MYLIEKCISDTHIVLELVETRVKSMPVGSDFDIWNYVYTILCEVPALVGSEEIDNIVESLMHGNGWL